MTKGWRNESERHSLSAKGIKTGRRDRVSIVSNPLTADLRELEKTSPLSYAFYRMMLMCDVKYDIYLNYVNQDDNYVFFRPMDRRTGKSGRIMDISKDRLLDFDWFEVKTVLEEMKEV